MCVCVQGVNVYRCVCMSGVRMCVCACVVYVYVCMRASVCVRVYLGKAVMTSHGRQWMKKPGECIDTLQLGHDFRGM